MLRWLAAENNQYIGNATQRNVGMNEALFISDSISAENISPSEKIQIMYYINIW